MVSHCFSVWKKIHGVELEDALSDEDKEDEEEDVLHDDLGTFGADDQFEVMCDELHDNMGGFMDDHIALALPDVIFGKSGGPTEENLLNAFVRDYHSPALRNDDRVDFWNDTGDERTFTKMMPGALCS